MNNKMKKQVEKFPAKKSAKNSPAKREGLSPEEKKARQKKYFKISLGVAGFSLMLALIALGLHWWNNSTKRVVGITADEVIERVAAEIDGIDESVQKWTMDIDLTTGSSNAHAQSKISLKADIKAVEEKGEFHMNLTQTSETTTDNGEPQSVEVAVESYAFRSGDEWYNYSSEDGDEWIYSVASEEEADVLGNEKNLLRELLELDVDWTLDSRTKRVERKHAYVCRADIPVETAMKLLALFDMDSAFLVESDGQSYLKGKTVEIVLAVYEENNLPAELSISCVELYQNIWDTMKEEAIALSEATATEAAFEDENLSVNVFDVSIVFAGFEVDEDLSVPQDVLDSAVEYAGEWVEPAAKEWYDYFIENRGTDLEGLYGITEDNYQDITEEEWESIYYKEIGF